MFRQDPGCPPSCPGVSSLARRRHREDWWHRVTERHPSGAEARSFRGLLGTAEQLAEKARYRPTKRRAPYGRCSPKERPIVLRCWHARPTPWPADDQLPVICQVCWRRRDGKTVEPGALETCCTEKPFEAAKLSRTRAQRIPSRSRASAHSKTGYIGADQPPSSLFACSTAADHTFRKAGYASTSDVRLRLSDHAAKIATKHSAIQMPVKSQPLLSMCSGLSASSREMNDRYRRALSATKENPTFSRALRSRRTNPATSEHGRVNSHHPSLASQTGKRPEWSRAVAAAE